jgi:hypothetical protein
MNMPSACRRAGPAVRVLICCLAALPPAALADDPPPQTGQLEYFFNTDPGPGNGTVLAVTGNSLAFTANTAGLSPGTHKLYLRTRPNDGEWGPPFPMMVTIEPSSDHESVTAWEYSVGTPAAPGAGIALPAPSGNASTVQMQTTLALQDTPGTAMIYLRAKDSADTWGPPFPMTVAIEGSAGNEVPATLQYAWLTAGTAPAWQTIALPAPGAAAVSQAFEPSLAGLPLGTHMLAIRSLDGSGSAGVPFLMPLAVVPDSLTNHPPAADTLVAYASNADGVIAGSRVEIPLGSNPQTYHSLHLPLGAAAAGPAEVVAYVTSVTGETSPLANALFTIVADGTNGYAAWRANSGYFTVDEQAEGGVSGPLANPEQDAFPNQVEFAFGGNPRQDSAGLAPVLDSSGHQTVLRFRQLQGGSGHRAFNYTASGVRYTVQYAHTLTGPWTEGGSEVFVVLGVSDNGDGTDTVEVAPAAKVTAGQPKVFMRVAVHLL